jgi:cell wall-associated NlpC family hydrolase
VIPHYDNTEGGHHDTRFCYLGEARLHVFEALLDADTYVLGIDEHTGLVIDLDAGEATVVGNSTVTIRLRSDSFVYQVGDVIPVALLQDPWQLRNGTSAVAAAPSAAATSTTTVADIVVATSLDSVLDALNAEFTAALADRNAVNAVRAALELEQAIQDWSIDTLQSDVLDRARGALRSMISQLGDAAVSGVRDPRAVVSPYVEAMLAVRTVVRAEKRFDLSDVIRDAFAELGIEVRDTATGPEWSL